VILYEGTSEKRLWVNDPEWSQKAFASRAGRRAAYRARSPAWFAGGRLPHRHDALLGQLVPFEERTAALAAVDVVRGGLRATFEGLDGKG
jgi:hypothetical protein